MATEKISIKPGAEVHLVHAKGHHLPAKVTRVRDRNFIDLEADAGGEAKLVITSSPYDETGKRPDSWHLPEPDPKAEAPKA
jgi:hypothetical protein